MTVSTSNALAADARSLDALKLAAGTNDPKAIKEAAKQFESLFMREMLKSMREATMKSGMLDSEGEKLGTDLLDQQFAVQLSGMPGGLTDAITRQLTQQMTGAATGSASSTGNAPRSTLSLGALNLGAGGGSRINPTASQSGFVSQHGDAAERVAQATGIPASFMIGQAGHDRLGQERDPQCRRQQCLQPVRHQGRRRLDRQDGRDHHHRIRRRRAPQDDRQIPRLRLLRGLVPRLCPPHRREPALCPGPRQHRLGRRLRDRAAACRLRNRSGLCVQAQPGDQFHTADPAHAGLKGLFQ